MTFRADGATTLVVGGDQDRRGHAARARARNELDTLLARARESVFAYVGCIAPLTGGSLAPGERVARRMNRSSLTEAAALACRRKW